MAVYWDYSGLYGEERWSTNFPIGLRQSPISIRSDKANYNVSYSKNPLKFHESKTSFSLVNSGINVSFIPKVNGTDKVSYIYGGPLRGSYSFGECHLHWGRGENKGCEHEVDGKRYDAELHLVHRMMESSFPDALNRVNGLCVLGILLEVESNIETPDFLQNLITLTKMVHYKGDSIADTDQTIEPYMMLGDICKDYFTYEGSLTTPPLTECVRWIVFKTPLKISKGDYAILQDILAVERAVNDVEKTYYDPFARNDNCNVTGRPKIGDNYRSCCGTNWRTIEKSF